MKAGKTTSLEDAKEDITRYLEGSSFRDVIEAYIREKASGSEIKYREDMQPPETEVTLDKALEQNKKEAEAAQKKAEEKPEE